MQTSSDFPLIWWLFWWVFALLLYLVLYWWGKKVIAKVDADNLAKFEKLNSIRQEMERANSSAKGSSDEH